MSQQGYIGRNPGDGRTIVNRQTTHVTTGVQTSFTMTVGYEVGYLDVYLNGIKQTETLDYTASDGSTINFGLSFPPVNGDVLEFVSFETLNISNIKSARRNFSVGQDLDVSGKVTIGSSLTVASDLVVNGTFTTINTEILDVEDKTVGIASTSSPSNTTADGAGIVIYGGSDGDKSITWNSTKSNFVIVGGGVSIGTGVTISTPADNVLAFSVNSAEKARFNNFGAFTVGYEGEAWHESTYVGVLQAGSGAWIGQTPAAGARAEWVNNAYYDSVNTRWEYIAGDEANRIVLENGELKVQSADAGSADGAITWNEKLKMTVGGDFKIGAPTGIGITISSSGNVDSIGIVTATTFSGALAASNLTGALPAISGASLTNLNASNIASGTVPTARLGSGTASSSTFLRGDSTFQTVNTDLVSDTSPQLGGDLQSNGNDIDFADADKAVFGTGSDFSIYHDGSNSIQFFDAQVGAVRFRTDIGNSARSNLILGAGVDLYHSNSKKFETTSGGVEVFGVLQMDDGNSHIKLIDGARLDIGSSADLQIYHSGGENFIRGNASSSALFIDSCNEIQIRHLDTDGSNSEKMIVCNDDGGVELYHDNDKKMQTFSNGVEITGSYMYMGDGVEVRCGGGSDLRLYHNGTHSYVQAYNTGNLYVGTTHNNGMIFLTNNTGRWSLSNSGHLMPEANNTYDLGTSSYRIRNIYTNDLNLSNKGSSNDVDSTWGDYTIQEGESDLFLINNRSGKKFKFNLTEVS